MFPSLGGVRERERDFAGLLPEQLGQAKIGNFHPPIEGANLRELIHSGELDRGIPSCRSMPRTTLHTFVRVRTS